MPGEPSEYEIGSGCWSDYEVGFEMPEPEIIYFGVSPGWSPRQEWQGQIGCRLCGGVVVFSARDFTDPIPIDIRRCTPAQLADFIFVAPQDNPRGPGICMACMTWARDNELKVRMDREFALRGSNDPMPVEIAEGGTVPIRSEHLK